MLALSLPDARIEDSQAWEILRAGASDLLAWTAAEQVAEQVRVRFERWRQVDALLTAPSVKDHLIGTSPAWRAALRQIVEAARFTDASILLIGESGTGKERVARLIHDLDPQASPDAFVILDCTTVVPELAGSEFFGHERGAFTGAVAARDGAFADADGGTLFLDEAGELPAMLQAQLLRVVQEGTYKRVGSNAWQHARFRLVCATNRDLARDVASGAFRADLYHRIASWVFRLPPLRERREDILTLARHFLPVPPSGAAPAFDGPVRDYLLNRPYPGNVRELRQLVARIGARHVGPGPITLGDIPADDRPDDPHPRRGWRHGSFEEAIGRAVIGGAGLKEIRDAAADMAIRLAVLQENGNLKQAARRLGVTDRALQLRRATRRGPARGPEVDH